MFAIILAAVPRAAHADAFVINMTPGWDLEMTAMSDYIVRGISQTEGRPSVGATAVYTVANGWYAGASTERSAVGGQNVETDYVGGWKTAITPTLNYNIGLVYQTYPFSQFHAQNNVELQNIINYTKPWGTLIAALAVQPRGAVTIGAQTYSSLGADFNLPGKFTFGGRIGFLTSSNHRLQANYFDWTATLARDMGHNTTISAQYTGESVHCDGSTGLVGDDGGGCQPHSGGNRFVILLNFAF